MTVWFSYSSNVVSSGGCFTLYDSLLSYNRVLGSDCMIPVVEWHNGMDLVVIIYFTDLNLIYVQHLLQETEAKKKRLLSANRTKLALLAEVKYDSSSVLGLSLHADSTATFQLHWLCKLVYAARFLRRKYGSFVKSNSQKTRYKLKKKARYIPSPLGRASAFEDHDAARTEGPSSSKNPNFDLNQGSLVVCNGTSWSKLYDKSFSMSFW